jgi:hypothetical protein
MALCYVMQVGTGGNLDADLTASWKEQAMYDLAIVNAKPGRCEKCGGNGIYSWGAVINAKPSKSGTCFSCRGTGQQTERQRRRNSTYNRHKVARIMASDFVRDPGEDAADRWNEVFGDRF